LALLLVTATEDELAAGDTSVDTGGEFTKPAVLVEKCYVKSRCLRHSRQFATSVNVGIRPSKLAAEPQPFPAKAYAIENK
jgi:hypothetical protein